jgi:hypothetical protein
MKLHEVHNQVWQVSQQLKEQARECTIKHLLAHDRYQVYEQVPAQVHGQVYWLIYDPIRVSL